MPSTTEAPAANYSDPALWICRPGRADACAANLDATIIAKDGSTTREAFRADPDAAIDCFYAYPTVSMEATGNADFAVDRDLSRTVVQQFARFGARCRLFAPVYREVTLPALISLMSGKPMPLSWEPPMLTSSLHGKPIWPTTTRAEASCWWATARARACLRD